MRRWAQAFTNNVSYVYENLKKTEIKQIFGYKFGFGRGGEIGNLNEIYMILQREKNLGHLGNRTDRSINACI